MKNPEPNSKPYCWESYNPWKRRKEPNGTRRERQTYDGQGVINRAVNEYTSNFHKT